MTTGQMLRYGFGDGRLLRDAEDLVDHGGYFGAGRGVLALAGSYGSLRGAFCLQVSSRGGPM